MRQIVDCEPSILYKSRIILYIQYSELHVGTPLYQRRNARVKRSLIKTSRGPMFYM